MTFKRLNLTISLLMFICFYSLAQDLKRMDINGLLKFATENNYELREAKFKKIQSELSVKETKSNSYNFV